MDDSEANLRVKFRRRQVAEILFLFVCGTILFLFWHPLVLLPDSDLIAVYIREFFGAFLIIPLFVLLVCVVRKRTRNGGSILTGLSWTFLFLALAQLGLLYIASQRQYESDDPDRIEFLPSCVEACEPDLPHGSSCESLCRCLETYIFSRSRLRADYLATAIVYEASLITSGAFDGAFCAEGLNSAIEGLTN
jgi:hypothetical protein